VDLSTLLKKRAGQVIQLRNTLVIVSGGASALGQEVLDLRRTLRTRAGTILELHRALLLRCEVMQAMSAKSLNDDTKISNLEDERRRLVGVETQLSNDKSDLQRRLKKRSATIVKMRDAMTLRHRVLCVLSESIPQLRREVLDLKQEKLVLQRRLHQRSLKIVALRKSKDPRHIVLGALSDRVVREMGNVSRVVSASNTTISGLSIALGQSQALSLTLRQTLQKRAATVIASQKSLKQMSGVFGIVWSYAVHKEETATQRVVELEDEVVQVKRDRKELVLSKRKAVGALSEVVRSLSAVVDRRGKIVYKLNRSITLLSCQLSYTSATLSTRTMDLHDMQNRSEYVLAISLLAIAAFNDCW
jgi:hypothetical protein